MSSPPATPPGRSTSCSPRRGRPGRRRRSPACRCRRAGRRRPPGRPARPLARRARSARPRARPARAVRLRARPARRALRERRRRCIGGGSAAVARQRCGARPARRPPRLERPGDEPGGGILARRVLLERREDRLAARGARRLPRATACSAAAPNAAGSRSRGRRRHVVGDGRTVAGRVALGGPCDPTCASIVVPPLAGEG